MDRTLSFTTTATVRPSIVDKTYRSFTKHLKGVDFKNTTLFINIDPLPQTEGRKEVISVARKYFGEVIANMPDEANFTAAYNWCWRTPDTDFIFNLEDDWILTKDIEIDTLYKYFEDIPTMMQVALRAYKYTYDKFPLSPSLLHKKYYKAVGGNLNPNDNPEIQLRGKRFGIEMPSTNNHRISHKGRIIGYPEAKNEIVVKDIGREWMRKSDFKKPDKKWKFNSWVKK